MARCREALTCAAMLALAACHDLYYDAVYFDAPPGSPARLSLSSSELALPPTMVGTVQGSTAITLTNLGGQDTGQITVSSIGDPSLAIQVGCGFIPGGDTCVVPVSFEPTESRTVSTDAVITAIPGGVVHVHATGIGVVPPNVLAFSSLELGGVPIGTTSAPFAITVSNGGDVATGPLSVALGMLQFGLASDACSGQSLPPGGTCAISVSYRPQFASAAGDRAQITVLGFPGGIAKGTVHGFGYALAIAPQWPAAYAFAATPVGAISAAQAFAITNVSGEAITPLTTTLTGDATEFAITANTCGAQMLDAGATCTVTVAFAPTGSGMKAAQLDVQGTSFPSAIQDSTELLTGTAP